jgi:hypothetical protein
MRLVFAFAVGTIFDLFVFRDAFSYSDRDWLGSHIVISPFWLTLVFLFLCCFVLNFKVGHSLGGISPSSPPETLLESLDSRGLLIPIVILLGLTITHTVVLIRDTTVDPTTHNLMPFEYLISWFIVGIPAFIGSILARLVSRLLNRIRMQ